MRKARIVLLLLIGPSLVASRAGAGSLDPPGPPAPTMKTLLEVEPRIAVNPVNTPGDANATFVIAQPGSYHLTGNLTGESGKDGIRILAHEVTLDLMGFTLRGAAGSTHGIHALGTGEGVTVQNGVVTGWQGDGIHFSSSHGAVLDIRSIGNAGDGIFVNGYSAVRRCEARGNSGAGIRAGGFNLIEDSLAMANRGDGVIVSSGNLVRSNQSVSNGCGVVAGGSSANFRVISSGNRLDENFAFENAQNFNVEQTGNVITRNSAKIQPGCSSPTTPVNYVVVPGNFFSTSSDASTAKPWDNIDLP